MLIPDLTVLAENALKRRLDVVIHIWLETGFSLRFS